MATSPSARHTCSPNSDDMMRGDRLYHGVDIVDIDRIAQAVTRWGEPFLRRVFTEREVADAAGRMSSLAARFAAKEAVAKALGTGLLGPGAVLRGAHVA